MFLTCAPLLHLPCTCSHAAVLGLVKPSLEAASGTTRPAKTFRLQANFAHAQHLPIPKTYADACCAEYFCRDGKAGKNGTIYTQRGSTIWDCDSEISVPGQLSQTPKIRKCDFRYDRSSNT